MRVVRVFSCCALAALALAGAAAARFVADEGAPLVPLIESTGETTNAQTDGTTMDDTSTVDDTTAPTIEITLPTDGATYFAGHSYPAAYDCTDESDGSGIDTCVGTVEADAQIDTSSLGKHEFTVTARDHAGNEAGSTVHYTVVYGFAGFGDPLSSQAGREQEPGRAIPVTFSLGADLGPDVLADGYPASRPCAGGGLEPIGSPGESALQYDMATQMYIVVWKTRPDWGGTCRELVLRLRDGSEQSVQVTFRAAPLQGPPVETPSAPGQDNGKPDQDKGKPDTPGHGHGR